MADGGREAGSLGSPSSSSVRPEPVGGAWVTCYGQFRPGSAPRRDVLRLGILCGPANGMRQVPEKGGTLEKGGTIEDEASGAPVEHAFDARPGECFRIFAVADPGVLELQIDVRSPSGQEVAADHNNDRLPIVNPDGPFCAIEGGRHLVRFRALRWQGRFAMQFWKLP